MDELGDQNPAERRDDFAPGEPVTPQGIVEQYLALVDARRSQLEIVDEFVETYLEVVRNVAGEIAKLVPDRIAVETGYSCTPDRSRCIQVLRFDSIRFSFVHLRDVAYLSGAPVPEEIAGQVVLYVQEVPAGAQGASDGQLISSLLVYPLRREWRFMWGGSAGRLYPFSATDVLREKVLRDLRGVLTGSAGWRRWPEPEAIARVPAQILEIEPQREASIGFLRPSLKVQRGVVVPAGTGSEAPGGAGPADKPGRPERS